MTLQVIAESLQRLIPKVLFGERDRPYSLFAIRFHVAKIPQSPVLQLVLLEIEYIILCHTAFKALRRP